MALPKSKQTLADYMLRRCGAPVVNVEVSDVQLEDCIDDAVKMYQEYHYDGSERTYRLLEINAKVIEENQRIHQDLTAPVFNHDSEYKVGARVFHNPSKGTDSDTGFNIYIKTDSDLALDSDNKVFRKNYTKEQLYLKDSIALVEAGQLGIRIPENIIQITRVSKVDSFAQSGMYNYEYQYFLNNFDAFYGNAAGSGITGYYIQKQYVEHIDFMLNTSPAIRYSKAKNRLWLDIDWKRPKKGQYFLIECYEATDPEVYGDVYGDIWIKKYSSALLKMQWGTNLKKYENTELPGGVQLNGQALYDEGKAEKDELEEELKQNLQLEMDAIIRG